jgi:hypothetical protein
VEDLLLLEREGLDFNGKYYAVKMVAVVCDTPARKFVKQTKGHCGEGSSDRCIQSDRSDGVGRWIFEDLNSKLRTNVSFRSHKKLKSSSWSISFGKVELGLEIISP